jgi:beta-lactamase regulating signal transducer with metallopeptidase domain
MLLLESIWPILAAAAVKSLGLLALAGAAVLILRRASAAAKHWVWLGALCGALALPLFSISLPQWKILPAMPTPQVSTIVAPETSNSPVIAPTIEEPTPMTSSSPVVASAPIDWAAWAVIGWAIGAGIMLGPILLGMAALLRLSVRSRKISSEAMQELSAELNLHQRVRLLQSTQKSMPMSWGIWRATILLPAEWESWSDQRKRLVLLHELAHVQRMDALTHLIAQLARAAYWFNPLAWLALRRMAVEREHACDDIVLTYGNKAPDYAQELLTVATGYRPATLAGIAAVAMARPSTLETRMRAILDSTRNRRASTRRAVCIGMIALLAMLLPLAALHSRGAAAPVQPSADDLWKVTLDNGVVVELIGAANAPSKDQPWWRPDGSPLAERPYNEPIGASTTPQPNQKSLEIAVRLANLPSGFVPTVWRFDPSCTNVGGSGPLIQDEKAIDDLRAIAISAPADRSAMNISVGVATGPWTTVETNDAAFSGNSSGDVAFAPLMEKDGNAVVIVSYTMLDVQTQLVAIGIDGKEHTAGRSETAGGSIFMQMTATFDHLAVKDIKSIELQSRPYQWAEFKNVAISPGATVRSDRDPRIGGLTQTARDQINAGNYTAALGVLDQIIALDPNNQYAQNVRQFVQDKAILADQRKARQAYDAQTLLDRVLPESNFAGVPFEQVISYFRDTTGANIIVDNRALDVAGIDRHTPVTLKLHNVKFSKALSVILSLVGGTTKLAYTVDGNVITISTAEAIPQQPVLSAPLHGRVLGPEGTPVSGATVFVALPGPSDLRIQDGAADFTGTTHVVTGGDGVYDLPPQTGKFVVAALADSGYGQLDQDAISNTPDIQLMAWGELKGRLQHGTKPAPGVDLKAYSVDPAIMQSPVRISMVNRARTDADGRFEMDRMVPGEVQVDQYAMQRSGSHGMAFTETLGAAQVFGGQTTMLDLGGVGRPVVGKFIFPPGMNSTDYFINARAINLDVTSGPKAYLLEVDEQHNFQINDVPPGKYHVHVFLQKVRGERTQQPGQIQFTVPDVPGGVSDEPLVLPDIQLH